MGLRNIKLYSWVDIQEYLLQNIDSWPENMIFAQSYWDALTIWKKIDTSDEVIYKWLEDAFSPRWRNENHSIILESTSSHPRVFPVIIEETEETPKTQKFVPTLNKPNMLRKQIGKQEMPAQFIPSVPHITCFHSFKGGVGRTACAISYAKLIASKLGPEKVLLIDADFEAPGISWLIKEYNSIDVSFSDYLAMYHGCSNEGEEAVILDLMVEKLKSCNVEGIFIMPAFKSMNFTNSLEVTPDNLIRSASDPFIVSQMLFDLGKKLGVKNIVVDLRAGYSELSAGLILDPRVFRIFVTTLSGQSIEGTNHLLKAISQKAPSSRNSDPIPAVIINKVSNLHRESGLFEKMAGELIKDVNFFNEEDEGLKETFIPDYPIIACSFADDLIALPMRWKEASDVIQSKLNQQMQELLSWLPFESQDCCKISSISVTEMTEKRRQLFNFSKEISYAETSNTELFLSTESLRKFCSDHRVKIPISIIVGAKGAGKTYTMLQMVKRNSWPRYSSDVGIKEAEIAPMFFTLLCAQNLGDDTKARINDFNQETVRKLSTTLNETFNMLSIQEIRDQIRDTLSKSYHEGEWRQFWINLFAWSIGFNLGDIEAGKKLMAMLREKKKQVLFFIDGLEDLFQNIDNEEREKTALRALLQEVPEYIEQEPQRPIGMIGFVRRDMVINSVRQNSAQLLNKYDNYALKWNREEAYRLIVWTCHYSEAMHGLDIDNIDSHDETQLVECLYPLWGQKLGKDDSREGRSAQWTIGALSDLRGQIQARDIMRLLSKAAELSISDNRWSDRLLAPQAIRDAIIYCSREKINDIQIENKPLYGILNKLKHNVSNSRKIIPLEIDEISISSEDKKILENSGVIMLDNDKYYMSEIFRHELGYNYPKGARPPVVYLAKKAQSIYS